MAYFIKHCVANMPIFTYKHTLVGHVLLSCCDPLLKFLCGNWGLGTCNVENFRNSLWYFLCSVTKEGSKEKAQG